jgi:dynein heavy chain
MLLVGYKLTESGEYVTPPAGDLKSYLSHIEKFPLIPMPEAFGLHANADITKDLNETGLILKSMLRATMGSGGGGSSDQKASNTIAELVRNLIKTLPPNFDIEACERKYPILYEESMHSVLSQEMARFNKLLDRYALVYY